MRRPSQSICFTFLALTCAALSACGASQPPPKTAQDAKNLAPPPPRADVSKDARAELAEVTRAYEEAHAKPGAAVDCADQAQRFADLAARYPKLVEARFNEGVVWEDCGKTDNAEQAYQAAVRQMPGFGPALNNLGFIALKRGQLALATEYFNKAAAAKNSEGYVNLAMLQREQALRGDRQALKEAVDNVHRALATDASNIEAYELLATVVYDHARNPAELQIARLICLQAILQHPDYAPIYNLFGLVLLRMNEVTRALKQFRKAVEVNPSFVNALMNIGAVTLSFRDYKTAEESFRKVLSLTEDAKIKFDATVGLAVADRGERKYDDAMKHYREAEAMRPNDPAVAYNMGILLQDYTFDAGNPGKAVDQLLEARRLLERYSVSGADKHKRADANRRIKNIDELVPMLREQQAAMAQPQPEAGGDAN